MKCNRIDGRCYDTLVYDNSDEASVRMAELNLFAIRMLEHMRRKYLWAENNDTLRKKMAENMIKKYNPETLFENKPTSQHDTSYVQNKGEKFAICLREKVSGQEKLHSMQMLKFVLLHELSHLSDDNYGHSYTFWRNFRILLQEAETIGYKSLNYAKTPENYCSLNINYNPIYDSIGKPSDY